MPDPPQIHPAFEKITAALQLVDQYAQRPDNGDWSSAPHWTAVLNTACCLLRLARTILERDTPHD